MGSSSERRRKIRLQVGQICPLCREKVHTQEVLSVCPDCRAVSHRECSGELASGRCTTLGCKFSARRTASGRVPAAPERGASGRRERASPAAKLRQPLAGAQSTLRTAMLFGGVVGFLFLALHCSQSALEDERVALKQRADAQLWKAQTEAEIRSYQASRDLLQDLVRRGPPPSNWRFSGRRLDLHAEGGAESVAVLAWNEVEDLQSPSPLSADFPSRFREGLRAVSVPNPNGSPMPRFAVGKSVRWAASTRYVVLLRVDSIRRAELVHPTMNGLRLSSGRRLEKRSALEEGLIPTGTPLHVQAEVVLHAYLYDLQGPTTYQGCLVVRESSPLAFVGSRLESVADPIDELLPPPSGESALPGADRAALRAALAQVRLVLEGTR